MKKYTYKSYENYNKAAIKFSQDKTVRTINTHCDRNNGIFTIEVERRKVEND